MKDQLYFSQKQQSRLVIIECAPWGLYFLIVIFDMTIKSIDEERLDAQLELIPSWDLYLKGVRLMLPHMSADHRSNYKRVLRWLLVDFQ